MNQEFFDKVAAALKKVVEVVAEVFERIAEAVRKVWNALRPLVAKIILYKAGLKIVNHRGRNKLVPIYGRML